MNKQIFAGEFYFYKKSEADTGCHKSCPEPGARMLAGIPGWVCLQEEILGASRV